MNPAAPPKVPIGVQVAALDAEIERKSRYLGDLVETGRMTRPQAEARLAPLIAAAATLATVAAHAGELRALFRAKRRHEADRAAAAEAEASS